MDLVDFLLDEEPGRRALFDPPDVYERLQLEALPLSGLTHTRGVDGLARRFLLVVENLPADEQALCHRSLLLALRLHGKDTYKGLPYACHLLRVAVRLARDYGVGDGCLLSAAVLHDSIEDHADDLVALTRRLAAGPDGGAAAAEPTAEPTAWPTIEPMTAAAALALLVDERVATIVTGLTNQPSPPSADADERRQLYADDVAAKIAGSFEVFLVKLSDFTDNAVGLQWSEDAAKTAKVASKYLPVFDVFDHQVSVYAAEGRLTPAQAQLALTTLETGREQCVRFVAALWR